MVWKIIWKDSLKFDGKMQNVSQLLPMIFVMDLIMYLKSTHQLIICLFYMMTILLFAFFPIKLAKGLYLCPPYRGGSEKIPNGGLLYTFWHASVYV